MEPVVSAFIASYAAGILANFSVDGVKALFSAAVRCKPSLSDKMQAVKTLHDVEQVFKDAVGVIDAQAGSGNIAVDDALLTAMRGIRFDHAHGTVHIGDATISAPVLATGGGAGATGTTTVEGDTCLKSKGTQIKLSGNAQIKITGNANIKQT